MTKPLTLDFTKLRTPPNHGDTLIVPDAARWAKTARANAEALRRTDLRLLNEPLTRWRRIIREAILGSDDRLMVVTGHQPSFVHPGVWAKHVVTSRLAAALEGVGVHLVVDNDVPKETTLAVPTMRDKRVDVHAVRFAEFPVGQAYEQIPRQTTEQITRFEQATREAMGDRYPGSMMSCFFKAMTEATVCRDWVDQMIAGRRGIEESFGVGLEERRVSEHWNSPLLVDMLLNAPRFAAAYNRALAGYRRVNRVRGTLRPIPDLLHRDGRWEVPVWAWQSGSNRRRLYVSRKADAVRLYVGDDEIGTFTAARLVSGDALEKGLEGWYLRPRAVTLTIWARLLLADLFIHGIGAAKYEGITDAIIADYYGVTPPHIVCVSATLHPDLPVTPTTLGSIRRLRHAVRDLHCNPQRNLAPGPGLERLVDQRAAAVRQALDLRKTDPGNHAARRRAFEAIRESNAALLRAKPDAVGVREAELARALDDLEQNTIARSREYFFGLYRRESLEQLADALPAPDDFRV